MKIFYFAFKMINSFRKKKLLFFYIKKYYFKIKFNNILNKNIISKKKK